MLSLYNTTTWWDEERDPGFPKRFDCGSPPETMSPKYQSTAAIDKLSLNDKQCAFLQRSVSSVTKQEQFVDDAFDGTSDTLKAGRTPAINGFYLPW